MPEALQQNRPSVFDQFAENFARSVGMNPADARTQKLFGHVHMTALRREDGMRLPQQVREAFYKFLERSGHLQMPPNGYPQDFRFDENVHRAADAWRQTVQAEQNTLLSNDPRAAAHDGVAGRITLSQLMERRNVPPTA